MNNIELIIPTLFGLESFCAREVRRLGYETTSVEDGRVTFAGDINAICRSNINIRTGERVLIKIGEFTAMSFEELFDATYALDWSSWIGRDDAFPVKGSCIRSQLASMRDCQAIIKKAVAKKLSEKHGLEWLPETGCTYQICFTVIKDRVTLMIDTSGDGLHKRGYRQVSNIAPIKETIAASMVMLSYWKFELPFADPFCGSGTIPIEAAMFKRNIAPGANRQFSAMSFPQISQEAWDNAHTEAIDNIHDVPLDIHASDIDPAAVELTMANARIAGVDKFISANVCPVSDIDLTEGSGTIICNPPYGERMGNIEESEKIYREMGKKFMSLNNWAYYIITSDEKFESCFGKKADKRRKVYNGMIKCNIYQYFNKKQGLVR